MSEGWDGDKVADDGPESVAIAKLRRKPFYKVIAVLAVLAAATGGVLYWFLHRPDPFRVLVAIDVDGQWWEGSRPAAALADQIGEGLEKIGFEPVKGGDPKVDKILSSSKTPEEAARKLGAGFVITGSLSPELIEHKIEGSILLEARSNTRLQVRYIGDKAGKAEEVPVFANGYGANKQEALAVLADGIAESVFDVAVPKLVEHEVIKSQLDRGDITTVSRLQKAKDYVELRARKLDQAAKAYQKTRATHLDFKGDPAKVTYYGSFDEVDYLAGVRDGRMLILSANVSPFIHPVSMELGWKYQLESLAFRTEDGKSDVLWRGYHVMGFPTLGREAGTVGFVEDLFARAKTVSVLSPPASAAERLRVDSQARFSDLTLSPRGTAIALTERPCRRDCVDSFTVLSVPLGKVEYTRKAWDQPGVATELYYGFDWIDDRQIVVAVKDERPRPPVDPADGEDGEPLQGDPKRGGIELKVVDLSKSPPLERSIAQLDAGESCVGVSASRDGKRLASSCNGRITFFDAMTGEASATDELGYSPSWSPDGAKIAFVRAGDILVMSTADKKITRLTANEFSESRPMFSSDGKRIYFQSQEQDPNIQTRVTSVIASVEVP